VASQWAADGGGRFPAKQSRGRGHGGSSLLGFDLVVLGADFSGLRRPELPPRRSASLMPPQGRSTGSTAWRFRPTSNGQGCSATQRGLTACLFEGRSSQKDPRLRSFATASRIIPRGVGGPATRSKILIGVAGGPRRSRTDLSAGARTGRGGWNLMVRGDDVRAPRPSRSHHFGLARGDVRRHA